MKKLPKFKSEEEEARFWETHSPLDYPGHFSDVESPFQVDPELLKRVSSERHRRKRMLTLRIGENQIDLAKIIARWKGLGYQTQMRIWVIEGIRREIEEHPQIRRLLTSKK